MSTTSLDQIFQRPGLNIKQSALQQICGLSVDSQHPSYRMTNIICTVGPACDTVESLKELVNAGMNICRFNLAHATHKYHLKALHNLREAIAQAEHSAHSQVATAMDIGGPGARTGKFKEGLETPFKMTKGEETKFTSDQSFAEASDKGNIFVPHSFIERAQVGNQIFIDDGPLCFEVQSKDKTSINCSVIHQGEINHQSQCHIPMTLPTAKPELTDKDKEDLKFCVEHSVDMIFLSWVWCPEIVANVREHLGEEGSLIKIVAKIENYQGVKNIDEILKVVDGIMVARGDLGIDIPPEKVVLAQKMMIGRANMAGVPVICAAQMLDSMVTNARPTRAEASDVANAILDGADCVMLSKETAVGKYPVAATKTLASICKEAENALYHARMFKELRGVTPIPTDNVHSTSIAAVEASFRSRATAIIVVTNSGRSATLIARYRPHCVIIAITKSHHTARQLNLYRGIFAVLHTGASCDEWYMDIDMRIHYALGFAKNRGYVKPKDRAILVTGQQSGPGSTNTVRSIIIPHTNEKPYFLNIPNNTEHLGIDDPCNDSFSGEEDYYEEGYEEEESDDGKKKMFDL